MLERVRGRKRATGESRAGCRSRREGTAELTSAFLPSCTRFRTPGPLLSPSHWSLLNLLLPTSHSNSAPLPPSTLLLLTSFLRQLPSLPASSSSTSSLFAEVATTAERVLPLLRVSAEGLLDLFGDALGAWSSRQASVGADEVKGWQVLLSVLAKALDRSLPNNLNRKKVRTCPLSSVVTKRDFEGKY